MTFFCYPDIIPPTVGEQRLPEAQVEATHTSTECAAAEYKIEYVAAHVRNPFECQHEHM